jgi:hypothetical protein
MVGNLWHAVVVANDWASSDAWFMAAVAVAEARGPGGLCDVVGAGDYINHSIFNLGEIERAVARLHSANLLVEDSGRFSLSSEGAALWDRSPSRLVLERMMWLEGALRAHEFDPAAPGLLDPAEYRNAVAAYRQRFAKTIERVDRRPQAEP